ncbi:MAG: dihydropteroate synthase [Deltaproteobacteria bacterium]|nr:dihydropteroate synthase [Deltaproteobacteria bacterium]MBW2143544.1 dihydropteroate synthase [Deltaproteobacteria bacterium]
MFIVGERVNTSRKQIDEAVANRDAAYIQSDVKAQVEAGADVIDVNAGSRRASEIGDLLWLIDVIEDAVPHVRVCLDSSNPDSLKAVLGRPTQRPMLNSTTAEKIRFESMVQVIETRECDVVALCIDDRGIPKSVDQALENAVRLVYDLEALGVNRDRIYLDPVIQTTSTNGMAGLMALETIERIHHELTGINTICGLSNISFGLPKRPLLNRAFLTLAVRAGLTAAIIDPLDKRLMGGLMATEVLLGRDEWCRAYLTAFRQGRLEG